MLEPKEFHAGIDSLHGTSHSEEKIIEQKCTTGESFYEVDEKTSLTQYYSHFTDGPYDAISQCVNQDAEPITTLKGISKDCTKTDKNSCLANKIKPKIWKCSYNCGKIFTQERYMKNHILVIHENTNLVQCKVCFRFLSTKARLKSHMLRHSGVQHLVCLICMNKRSNDLSCIRHHLLEKHGIGRKHYLFHDSYYEMSLKEISLMKMTKSQGSMLTSSCSEIKGSIGSGSKSACDLNELNCKLMEKSRRVKCLLSSKESTDGIVLKEKGEFPLEKMGFHGSHISNVCKTKKQKIVTAENGMKLVKLPNGQFKKITSNCEFVHILRCW